MRTLFLLISILANQAFAQEATIAELEALLPDIGAKSFEARQVPQQEWETIAYQLGAPGNKERKAVCLAMVEMLKRKRTRYQGKIFILKQLERIGREEVVPALTEYMGHEKAGVQDAARRALANNPANAATKALITRYNEAKGMPERRALLNAIGFRADPSSKDFLERAAMTTKGPAQAAAISALGQIQTQDVAKTMLHETEDKDALLRAADQSPSDTVAMSIYRSLAANNTGPFGAAAFRGMLYRADATEVIELVAANLSSDDKLRRQIAISRARTLSPTSLKLLVAGMQKRPIAGQIAILTAIGTQRDRATLPDVITATKSEHTEVQRAAIEALGNIGDETTFATLIEFLRDEEPNRGLARTALQRIHDKSIDASIISTAESTPDTVLRLQLVDILNSRRSVAAIPMFTKLLSDNSPDFRQRAFGALSRLGTASEVGHMLHALTNLSGAEKDRAEKQLVNLCRRLPEDSSPVADYFQHAAPDTQLKLMPLLGRIGDAQSLEIVRASLKSDNAQRVTAGVVALSNWPTAEVAPDLKRLASMATNAGEKTRTLRALARVAVLGGSDTEKLGYLKFVMEAANRTAEKELALERAKAVRTVESLNFVLPFIADADLGKRARRTVVELAHHRGLREENRAAFEPALKSVTPLLADEKLVDRAKKYLANE